MRYLIILLVILAGCKKVEIKQNPRFVGKWIQDSIEVGGKRFTPATWETDLTITKDSFVIVTASSELMFIQVTESKYTCSKDSIFTDQAKYRWRMPADSLLELRETDYNDSVVINWFHK